MIIHKMKLIINKPMIQIQVLVKNIIKKIKKTLSQVIRELHKKEFHAVQNKIVSFIDNYVYMPIIYKYL
jgi:hypothetical protein